MRFVARIAVRTMVILVVYDLLIAITRPDATPNIDVGTRNTVIAQRYVDSPVAGAVITGSSIAARVSPDFLEADPYGSMIYDLGLVGQGPATGLDIILHRAEAPRLVFVEMNLYRVALDQTFVGRLFAEPGMTLRRWFPALRSEYRPIDLSVTLMWRWLRELVVKPSSQRNAADLDHPDREQAVLDGSNRLPQDDGSDEPPSTSEMAASDAMLDLISRQLDLLRSRHVRVVLVRFPMDHRVEVNKSWGYLLTQSEMRFHEPDYEWLPISDPESYQTTDGVHLTRASAARMALVLRRFVEQSGLSPTNQAASPPKSGTASRSTP
jgi:hypothetical protein